MFGYSGQNIIKYEKIYFYSYYVLLSNLHI